MNIENYKNLLNDKFLNELNHDTGYFTYENIAPNKIKIIEKI